MPEFGDYSANYPSALLNRRDILVTANPRDLKNADLETLGVPLFAKDVVKRLTTPVAIQAYIDTLKYNVYNTQKSMHAILQDRTAHCFEIAIGLAYPLLQMRGYNPKLIYINADPATDSDDHAIVAYRTNVGYGSVGWGGVNREFGSRPPIFPSYDHLMTSFYDKYTEPSSAGPIHCMRGYTDPIDLIVQPENTDWFWAKGVNALEYFWYHCTDNVMCTEVTTGMRYVYPASLSTDEHSESIL